MPKLLKILDDLEAAIPEMRDVLNSDESYMSGEDDAEHEEPDADEEGAPSDEDADNEMPPMGDEEEPADLDTPPPFPPMMKKKPKKGLPF